MQSVCIVHAAVDLRFSIWGISPLPCATSTPPLGPKCFQVVDRKCSLACSSFFLLFTGCLCVLLSISDRTSAGKLRLQSLSALFMKQPRIFWPESLPWQSMPPQSVSTLTRCCTNRSKSSIMSTPRIVHSSLSIQVWVSQYCGGHSDWSFALPSHPEGFLFPSLYSE